MTNFVSGVYCVDHEFVHKLLTEFYKLHLQDQHQIIHYKKRIQDYDPELDESKVFQQSVLYWGTMQTMREQPAIMTDIVRAHYNVHKAFRDLDNTNGESFSKKLPGLEYFEQLPSTYMKTEAIRLYVQMFEPDSTWLNNLLPAIFEIFVMCFLLFAFDLYLDIDLIRAYQSQGDICNAETCRLVASDGNFSESTKAYKIATIISSVLVVPSSLAYFLMTWFMFQVPRRLLVVEGRAWEWFIQVFNPFIYPVTFFIRYIKVQTDPKSFGKAERYQECENIWTILRRIEVGIEATGQLLVQLWLLVPFIPEINAWTALETFQHSWKGFGYLISLGYSEATFLEQMSAKFLFSAAGACAIVTMIRTTKNSSSAPSIMARFLFFTSCALQMATRLMTIRLFFLTDLPNIYKLIAVIIHVLIEVVIKITFEWPPCSSLKTLSNKVQMVFR